MQTWSIIIMEKDKAISSTPIDIDYNISAQELLQLLKEQGLYTGQVRQSTDFLVWDRMLVSLQGNDGHEYARLLNREKCNMTPNARPGSLGDAINKYLSQPEVRANMARQASKIANRPSCPTCHSTRLTKLSAGSRFIDRMFFGVFSPEAKAQFRCESCGYMW